MEKTLAPAIAKILKPLLQGKGLIMAELMLHWQEIVPDIAPHAWPERIAGDRLVLAVATDSAKQNLLYQTPQVIERVNTWFGSPVIHTMTFVTKGVNISPDK